MDCVIRLERGVERCAWSRVFLFFFRLFPGEFREREKNLLHVDFDNWGSYYLYQSLWVEPGPDLRVLKKKLRQDLFVPVI